MIKRILAVLLALGASLTIALGVQSAAQADAFGCDSWAAGEYAGYAIPGGALCHRIDGDGRTITNEGADFGTVRLCNWRIDFRYQDTNGSTYRVETGATQNTCNSGSVVHAQNKTLPAYGTACAYLYVNGAYVTKQCHSITA